MQLPNSFTTVTPLSKIIAAVLFITFPFLGFYLGVQYQKGISPQISNQVTPSPTSSCKRYETVCDPNYTDPNGGCRPKEVCVDPSPTTPADINPTTYEGMFCGGIAGKECPLGYTCQITDRNPDASGKCVSAIYDPKPTSAGCSRELKICPNGGQVGRSGPYCDFDPCPGVEQTACTDEAKICPDGSSVGRTAPNCEFAACPTN